MASKTEILTEINGYKNAGQDLVRKRYIRELSEYTKNDTILYASAFPCNIPGVPSNILNISLSDIQGFMTCLYELHSESMICLPYHLMQMIFTRLMYCQLSTSIGKRSKT